MLRCCVATLSNIDLDTEFEDGTILDCQYEKEGNQSMILKNGIWKWNEGSIESRFTQ
jgi:hypothetical protein